MIIQSMTIGIRVSFLKLGAGECGVDAFFCSGLGPVKLISGLFGAIPSLLRSIFILVSLIIIKKCIFRHNNTPLLPWVKKYILFGCFFTPHQFQPASLFIHSR